MNREKENIVKEYSKIRESYVEFTSQLKDLVEKTLTKKKIKFHIVESRTKTTESLKDKLRRKGERYTRNLNIIPDLCGIRIILYYPDQIDVVKKEISKILEIVEIVDKRQILDNDQFGYLSVHMVCKIDNSRKKLIEWQEYEFFQAEIQIRSILQHAWAMVSHALMYKRESEAPQTMQRKLNQLAGLFEIADEYFISIRDTESNISKTIEESLSDKSMIVDIDLVSLSKFLSKPEIRKYFGNLARKSYVKYNADTHESCYRDLNDALKIAEIKTINEFEEKLDFKPREVKLYFQILDGLGQIARYCIAEFASLLILGFKVENLDRNQLLVIGKSEKEIEYILNAKEEVRKHNNGS